MGPICAPITNLTKCDDAISGDGGHDKTLRATCECFRFGLDDATIWRVMRWFNETKCKPGWSEHELQHKIESARSFVTQSGEVGVRLHSTNNGRGVAKSNVVEEWPDPPPLRSAPIPPPFPLAQAFPSSVAPIRDFVAAMAEATQVPVDMPAMLLLPITTLCLAQKVEVETGPDHTEIASLYTLTLLESGNRKSSVVKRMCHPLQVWEQSEAERLAPIVAAQSERRRIAEARLGVLRKKAAKGDVEATKEAEELAQQLASEKVETVPQLTTTEPTPEALSALMEQNHERILIASAEADALDVMLGRYTKGNSPNFGIFLSGHSGDAFRQDRTGRPAIHLSNPALSNGLVVQPEAVSQLFANRQARGRGLIGRFLKNVPVSLLGHRKTNPSPVPKELSAAYEQVLRRLLSTPIPERPVILKLNPNATAHFCAFCEWIEPQLGTDGALHVHSEWAGKLVGAVARIAMALHGLRWGLTGELLPAIDGPTMGAALSWAPYLIDHERIAAGIVGTDPTVALAERVLRWLAQRPPEPGQPDEFSRRDCFSGCRSESVQRVEVLDPAFSLLVDFGYIRPLDQPERPGPGRKRSGRFVVNPRWRTRGDQA